MKYDITLKELFQQIPFSLLQNLVGCQAREVLNIEYSSTKRRYPDLIVRLETERIYHLELQTGNDATMPWRMLEYFALINRLYRQSPLQQVLYVGTGKLNMAGLLNEGRLHFEYQVINIITLKELFQQIPFSLLQNLVGCQAREVLRR